MIMERYLALVSVKLLVLFWYSVLAHATVERWKSSGFKVSWLGVVESYSVIVRL